MWSVQALTTVTEILGNPVALLILAGLVFGRLARVDMRVALGYLRLIIVGCATLVLLRLVAKAGWLLPVAGPYFPSGHAGVTMLVLGATAAIVPGPALRRRCMLMFAIGGAFCIGIGRIAAGAHPSIDVVGGMMVALSCLAWTPRHAQPWHGVASIGLCLLAYPAIAAVTWLWLPSAAQLLALLGRGATPFG
jgi:membrane-associated phospholipid phosphatase